MKVPVTLVQGWASKSLLLPFVHFGLFTRRFLVLLPHIYTSTMNSPANSIIRFYQQNTSTIPSPDFSTGNSSRPHSQDQLNTQLSPTQPLQFGMHYIRSAGEYERPSAAEANTAVNTANAFSVLNSCGTEGRTWNETLYQKVENLPTDDLPSVLSASWRRLPESIGTIYSDTDLVGSSQLDKHSFRKFIRSPNKWFRSLSSKNTPDDIVTLGSMLMKELNVITQDSPGLVADFVTLVPDNDDQGSNYSTFNIKRDNGSADGIGDPQALYPDYLEFLVGTAVDDFSGINHDEEGDQGSKALIRNEAPLVHVDSNSGEVQTPSMFQKMMDQDDDDEDDDDEENYGSLKRTSTFRRLTIKTKDILKQWSTHHTLLTDEEEKENQDPQLNPPRRSLSLRGFSTLSLRRSVSFRGWSRHKNVGDLDHDDSHDYANLLELFDTSEFKQRLEEGDVYERKAYNLDKDDNEISFVTRFDNSTMEEQSTVDGITVQKAKSTSNVLRERNISANENIQLPTTFKRLNHEDSTENFFSVLRAKTIRRANSIRAAARAARAAMQSFEAH